MQAVAGLNLRTGRFDAMVSFYRDLLGLALEVTDGDGPRRANVELGGTRFGIVEDGSASSDSPASAPGNAGSGDTAATVLLRVADAAAEQRRLLGAGITFVREPQVLSWGGLVAELRDPDGNGVQLVSWAAPGAADHQAGDPEDERLQAWLETPEEGWSSVISPQSLAAATFLSGGPDGNRLRIRYFRRELDGAMMGKVWFGPETQGPPGHAHGGSMASMLDEAMGGAAWTAGHPVLAGELTTRFRRMLPLRTRCVVEARVVSVDRRKVYTQAELRDVDGVRYADGQALFIEIDPARFAVLLDGAGAIFKQLLDR